MGDNVEIDLYEELDQEFIPHNQEYENADLYDDVLPNSNSTPNNNNSNLSDNNSDHHHHRHSEETNGYNPNLSLNHIARRHQLYVGNLSWWTTDQDITDSVIAIGVNDFQEVKFFENRANGQSKGFCVITLGSENSMRIVMENLSKKELNGQNPMVTLPTKQALNQFESQQKTRPTPPTPQNPGQKGPMGMGGNSIQNIPPQGMGHQGMMRNGPPNNFRPMGMQNMQQGPPMQGGPMQQRMQGPPMHQGGPPMNHQQQQGMPPRFQNNWNGPPRPGMNNGMNNRPPGPGPNNGPPLGHRPQMNMSNPGPPRGPRPDWNRPPMHPGNYNQGGPPQNMQVPPHMQGPPRNMPPQMPVNPHGPPQALHGGPAPHVNPAFFNQQNPMPPQHPAVGGPVMGPGPQHGMPGNIPNIPHFNQQAPGPRNMWPIVANKPGFEQPSGPQQPQINEVEFEEIMGRNRTVSSSAIARAVSDAAAGEYTSAIETLATAISLIKQSKVANDERCKILINSLQDTLHGIETKSYNRRDRSRSRERSHRRQRRERSSSRSYRDRSRDRDREETRDRPREGNSRSRPRNKSPEPSESVTENSKRGGFYEERYRSDRDSRGDRDRREEHRRH